MDFPDQIDLEIQDKDKDKDKDKDSTATPSKESFYYEVIADVLKEINSKLDIEKHILARAKSSSAIDRKNLEALIQRVENHLNSTILSGWHDILGADLGGKRFRFFVRKTENNLVSAEIKLSDGNGLFSLKERSAGFR